MKRLITAVLIALTLTACAAPTVDAHSASYWHAKFQQERARFEREQRRVWLLQDGLPNAIYGVPPQNFYDMVLRPLLRRTARNANLWWPLCGVEA